MTKIKIISGYFLWTCFCRHRVQPYAEVFPLERWPVPFMDFRRRHNFCFCCDCLWWRSQVQFMHLSGF